MVLDKEELRERLGAGVSQVVELLCISDAEATRALRFYKWDLTKLQARTAAGGMPAACLACIQSTVLAA